MATDPVNPLTSNTITPPPAAGPGTPSHEPAAGGTGAPPKPEDLAAQLKAVQDRLSAMTQEQEARAKAEAEAKLTTSQKREKAEQEQAKIMADIQSRQWELDLREAGIPKEIAGMFAVPAKEARDGALRAALAAWTAAVDTARKAGGQAPVNPTTPAAPVAPATDPNAAYVNILKTMQGRKP